MRVEENFTRGIEKYRQRLCNTPQADHQFDAAEFAVVCLLLLRGPQTPGELRARSGRLHTFPDNAAVVAALAGLMEREGGPLVVQLPRIPGRKGSEYMHLFSGPVDVEAHADQARAAPAAGGAERASTSKLEQRVSRLEAEVEEPRQRLDRDDASDQD